MMSKFALFNGHTHLGDIEAISLEEALKSAKKLYPDISGLRAENTSDTEAYERNNPMSASEMRRAINAMVGNARPVVGKRV